MKPILTFQDYKKASETYGIPVACILGVAEQESKGSGFLSNDEPVILFERHIFHRLTSGKFSAQYPDISSATPGGYGRTGSFQHEKLRRAVALDRNAALQSASWGKFQIMGFNWRVCGEPDVQRFITRMYKSEVDHLQLFLNFIRKNGLDVKLARKDYAGFALGYNGKNYRKNNYDVSLKNHVESWERKMKNFL